MVEISGRRYLLCEFYREFSQAFFCAFYIGTLVAFYLFHRNEKLTFEFQLILQFDKLNRVWKLKSFIEIIK